MSFLFCKKFIFNYFYCQSRIIKSDDPNELFWHPTLENYRHLYLLLGACGIPLLGNTAYFRFLGICQPKIVETVVVNYAARVVGSLDGQLAKLAGRRVIGFAGTDEILLIVLLVVRVEIDINPTKKLTSKNLFKILWVVTLA